MKIMFAMKSLTDTS